MKDHLQRLVDERASDFEKLKVIVDKADEESREFTSEENQEFTRINEALNERDARIEAMTERMEREGKADEARARAEQFLRPERDQERRQDDEQPSLDQRVLAWARGEGASSIDINMSEVRAVRSHDGSLEVRDLTVGTAAGGGDTVPTSFRRELYEHLIENTGIRRTRAEVITTASGESLILPKTTAHSTAGTIVAEGGIIGEADPAFAQGTLQAYKYPRLVQVSSELLQDTGVNLLDYLAREVGQSLANGSGAHYVTGTGSSQPNGVITAGSAIVTGGTGQSGIPTGDELIDLFYGVTEPYAAQGEWFMRRATVGEVRSLKDSNNQYLWQPGLSANVPNTLLGQPIVTDPNVPACATDATSVAFGDFSAYKIRDVGSIRFERSDDFAFNTDLVTFRAILRTDGDLLDTTGAIGVYVGGSA